MQKGEVLCWCGEGCLEKGFCHNITLFLSQFSLFFFCSVAKSDLV